MYSTVLIIGGINFLTALCLFSGNIFYISSNFTNAVMLKKTSLIIISILCYVWSFGQFNDSVHHHFSFTSTGVFNKTKDQQSFVFNNSIGYEVNKKRIAYNTGASWIYGTQNKQLSNNDVSAAANVDYLKDIRKLYYWALINYDNSYSLKINYRFQSGVGVGFNAFKSPKFNFEISDGFVFETSDLTDPVIGKDVYQTVRNSLRIKYRWAYNSTFSLEGTNFYQPSVSDFRDYIFKLNNKLSVKLNKWLSLNAAMAYNRISRTNRENVILTYGITIENYY